MNAFKTSLYQVQISDLPYSHVGHRGREGLVEELAELVGICADLCEVVEQ